MVCSFTDVVYTPVIASTYSYMHSNEEADTMRNETVILQPSDVLHIPGLGFDGLVGYSPIAMARNAIGMAIACAGPIVATWKLDNHEIAMLGDAGANTMGVLLGFIFSMTLPLWLLAPLAAVLLAMNLLSERFSFTKVIASVPVLRHLDALFRPRDLR